MIIKSAEFITSAVNPSHYPPAKLPEIAFIGRSNVGKSSLINKLVNRKRLVKTSSTPGRTQLINFFDINKEFSFVDLPGFGYAKVPARVKKNWAPMIKTYLSTRETLKGVVFIMDMRRVPGIEEMELINWFYDIELNRIQVITKVDKLKRSKIKMHHSRIAQALGFEKNDFILFSAKSGLGKSDVWKAVESLLLSDMNLIEEEITETD